MNVYIDIETIPSQRNEAKAIVAAKVKHPATHKKPETIAKWNVEQRPAVEEEQWRKTALNGAWGEIVCICWAVDDGEVRGATRPTVDRSEGDMIADFFTAIAAEREAQNKRTITWVGHNITGFDLRFIWHRAVVLGVKPRINLRHDSKPWGEFVFDTMAQWSGRDYIKLTELCEALRIDVGHDDTIDGSQVWDCYQRGDFDTILNHCIADVERVREVHKRMEFLA